MYSKWMEHAKIPISNRADAKSMVHLPPLLRLALDTPLGPVARHGGAPRAARGRARRLLPCAPAHRRRARAVREPPPRRRGRPCSRCRRHRTAAATTTSPRSSGAPPRPAPPPRTPAPATPTSTSTPTTPPTPIPTRAPRTPAPPPGAAAAAADTARSRSRRPPFAQAFPCRATATASPKNAKSISQGLPCRRCRGSMLPTTLTLRSQTPRSKMPHFRATTT